MRTHAHTQAVLCAHLPWQAAELMAEWAPIEVADALELLSPDFKNDEVCSATAGY